MFQTLDSAMNPLSVTKIRLKWKLRELTASLMSVQTVVDDMLNTMANLATRVNELERRLDELTKLEGDESGKKVRGADDVKLYGMIETAMGSIRKQAKARSSMRRSSSKAGPRNIRSLGSKSGMVNKRVKFADVETPKPPPRSRRASVIEDPLPPPPSQEELEESLHMGEYDELLHDRKEEIRSTKPRLNMARTVVRAQLHSPPSEKRKAPLPPNILKLANRALEQKEKEEV